MLDEMAIRGILLTGAAGAGKTMLGCALAFAFKVRGMRVGVMKPIAPGCAEIKGALVSADAAALLASASSDLPMELAAPFPYHHAAPPFGDAAEALRFEKIVAAYREIEARSDVIIVEDAGGLATAIDATRDFADLASALELESVVVLANRDGLIEEAVRIAALARRRSVSIKGFVLNALSSEASATTGENSRAVAAATEMPCLGIVRYKEPVSLEIVERLL